ITLLAQLLKIERCRDGLCVGRDHFDRGWFRGHILGVIFEPYGSAVEHRRSVLRGGGVDRFIAYGTRGDDLFALFQIESEILPKIFRPKRGVLFFRVDDRGALIVLWIRCGKHEGDAHGYRVSTLVIFLQCLLFWIVVQVFSRFLYHLRERRKYFNFSNVRTARGFFFHLLLVGRQKARCCLIVSLAQYPSFVQR